MKIQLLALDRHKKLIAGSQRLDLTYSTSSHGGNRETTVSFHLVLSWSFLFASPHVVFMACSSEITHLRHEFFGVPLFLFPWGFHSKACFVMAIHIYMFHYNVFKGIYVDFHSMLIYFLIVFSRCTMRSYNLNANIIVLLVHLLFVIPVPAVWKLNLDSLFKPCILPGRKLLGFLIMWLWAYLIRPIQKHVVSNKLYVKVFRQ